jgi:hypothetical protein
MIHVFFAAWRSFDMAMGAALIAQISQINLNIFQPDS